MTTHTTAHPLDLGPVCHQVAGLLDAITDDQLMGPTPCPAYAVRDVLAHLSGLAVAFREAAAKRLGPATDTPPDSTRPVLDDDWRVVLPDQLIQLADAWRSPDAWQGGTRAGGVDLPGQLAGLVALNEVLIHGWDVARSTGQVYRPDQDSLRAAHAMLAEGAVSGQSEPAEDGIFGPPVSVPPDAPLLDRVIALSGRDPRWTP